MKERFVGCTSRGIRLPIIREGDDLASIVTTSLLKASDSEGFTFNDKDVVAITESVVARAQGNYCTIDDIAKDISDKFGRNSTIGVIFPILSRNRFSICLKAIARGVKKIVMMLSYPSDEVGNELVSLDQLDEYAINPYSDVLTIDLYRKYFGENRHPFTNVDYLSFYKELIQEEGCQAEIILANNPREILKYTDKVLCCDIHSRYRTSRILKNNGGKIVLTLSDIMSSSINGSGFNSRYGLLGSNKADENRIKLFPEEGKELVEEIQKLIKERTGKDIEVMIYGDGAFKDPVGKIWELADPVVSPFYTDGLKGRPNELKLKYLADNDYKDLQGDLLKEAIEASIKKKDENLKGKMISEGTTPREITDLLGSLCDLTSGSGDKGTPVVLVQGYFDNYTN